MQKKMSRQIYRVPWHDYRSKCIYMVTLNKAPGVQDFGMLCGDPAIPRGQLGAPYVRATHVGVAIKDKIRTFYETDPAARIFQYALMPDHFHLLISIEKPTQDTLSQIISRFKVAVNHQAGITPVFDKGFNDQILKPGRGLDTLSRRTCLALNSHARQIAPRVGC